MSEDSDQRRILTLNCGSSSLKFAIYRAGPESLQALLSGEVQSIGGASGNFKAHDASGEMLVDETPTCTTHQQAMLLIDDLLAQRSELTPQAVAHRIVHGGPELRRHCRIDAPTMRLLEGASAFAPLHAVAALALVRHAQLRYPTLPQIACFDTAFHACLPVVARRFALARELQAHGIERYGFHGLSCESIVRQLGAALPPRTIVAHLGNGASISALRDGVSIDTSMGLTPSGGVMMGTRSGDLDPGLLIHLLRSEAIDADRLEYLLDHRSGLLGVSGIDSDMRVLQQASGSNADARLAIEMFCYAVRKQIAAMIAALDGVDLLVFTGGIGEHDAVVRAAICRGLEWIGAQLDESRNLAAADPLQAGSSRCAIRVIESREDQQLARHAWQLTGSPT